MHFPPKKYAGLFGDPLVADWLKDYPAPNTKREHLMRFGRLLAATGMTPQQVLDEVRAGNGKPLKERMKEYCRKLEQQGKTASASMTLSTLRSYLEWHEVGNLVNWTRKDIIPIIAVRTQRRVPKKEDVYRIVEGIEASHLGKERIGRYKAMIWTAYQSGIRPSALLRLRICDIDLNSETPIPIKITPQIDTKIRRPLAKIGYYWTFIGKQAHQAIRDYLTLREVFRDEKLAPDSYLFENFHYRNEKVGLTSWNKIVAGLAKYGGFKRGEISPHSFRHAARKQFRMYVDDQVGTVLTGHLIKGSEEAYFDRSDREYLRSQYARIQWDRDEMVSPEAHKQTALRLKEQEYVIKNLEAKITATGMANMTVEQIQNMRRKATEEVASDPRVLQALAKALIEKYGEQFRERLIAIRSSS